MLAMPPLDQIPKSKKKRPFSKRNTIYLGEPESAEIDSSKKVQNNVVFCTFMQENQENARVPLTFTYSWTPHWGGALRTHIAY